MQSDKWQGKLCQVLSIPGGEIFRRPLDFKRGGGKIIIVGYGRDFRIASTSQRRRGGN
ncbi:uncharacterized protein CIMG_13079 [Coccidioides immitis RS]|uniref:Uncharacterized protein n=1 Tax=Coccidioides immitis (strain RS) TaxID=246410 RepID=J3K8U5_COCIM|nr:uncharacterized protein CIMG_13079 [Coccidioides immitis RS]EAS31274.3 hypothetical protein CIMG_13079 [Coccidioides immitis RS]